MNLEQVAVNERFEVLTYGNLFAVVWRGKGVADDYPLLYSLEREARERVGKPLASLVVVHDRAVAQVSADERKSMGEIEKHKGDGFYRAQVLALLATGFGAAIIRGIVAAGMLLPKDHPRKVVSTADEAMAWIRPYILPAVSEDALAPLRAKLVQR